MTKKQTHSITITQNKDFMLNLMSQTAAENPFFQEDLRQFGLVQEYSNFKKEMDEAANKMPWCNFKACRGKKQPKGGCEHKQ